jgi:predicted pyridoxine 5'-phosphate oxidase superfamily flavin-nucleotide-binding protein
MWHLLPSVENPRVHLFLIDYAHRERVKIWGTARVIDDDPGLVDRLMPKGYKARASQVILLNVDAWDANRPQHIPQRFEAAAVAAAIEERDQRIAALEAQLAKLRAALPP